MAISVVFAAAAAVLTGADAYKVSGLRTPASGFSQSFTDRYSPLKYVANVGPYSSRSGEGISPEVPAGCEVDQVILLGRHGERYPSKGDAKDQKKVLKKIHKNHPEPFVGDLAFLNEWEYFLEGHEYDAGVEIGYGAYSGLSDMYNFGAQFRGKYGDLWDGQSTLPIFASGSERVINSARLFGEGFLGYNYTQLGAVNIIPETNSVGGDAISVQYCDSSDEDTTSCGDLPDSWPQFEVAATRLNELYGGLDLSAKDIYDLLELAAFNLILEGSASPWLNVFTADEWITWEYVRSLEFYCLRGPGSNAAKAIGNTFLNATVSLLNAGPGTLPLSLNFCHDTDIARVLAGGNIAAPTKNLSTEEVVFGHGWSLADVVPMGARLVFERLKCRAPFLSNSTDLSSSNYTGPTNFTGVPDGSTVTNLTSYSPLANSSSYVGATISGSTIKTNSTSGNSTYPLETSYFVRILLNDAVVPLDYGHGGPGYSCPLDTFTDYVLEQTRAYNYTTICKTEKKNVPVSPTYWWTYNSSDALNYPSGPIPAYNEGTV